MTSLIDELRLWMKMHESAHLEFKEAKNGFDTDKLTKYCCALANEEGGHLILGVTDKRLFSRFNQINNGASLDQNWSKFKVID